MSFQYAQQWHGWQLDPAGERPNSEDGYAPVLVVIFCIPLSALVPNRYGCNVLDTSGPLRRFAPRSYLTTTPNEQGNR